MSSVNSALEKFFSHTAPIAPGQLILVAFSGGPDSTVLLAALQDLATRRGFRLRSVHIDHGLDAGSSQRGEAAKALSTKLGIPFHLVRPKPSGLEGLSLEAAARQMRYAALETLRQDLGARYIATAHHRDDQMETVALRLAFGTGLEGLEAIRPVYRRVVRPLLRIPRQAILDDLRRRRLPATQDPTNRILAHPRNLLRRRILPLLEHAEPGTGDRLVALASASRGARQALSRKLFHLLEPRPVEGGWGMPLKTFQELPREIQSLALNSLHALAGHPYPPTQAARRELFRQLRENGRVRADCGAGLHWKRRGKLLVVASHATRTPFFSYTLQVPGEVCIGELGVSLRLSSVAEPEGRGSLGESRRAEGPVGTLGVVQRALFSQVLTAGETVTIRNRRPGDRIHLPGTRASRPLKALFAARSVPFRSRDRQLLVCAQGSIIWIPGFGVAGRFRPRQEGPNWLAEISANEQ